MRAPARTPSIASSLLLPSAAHRYKVSSHSLTMMKSSIRYGRKVVVAHSTDHHTARRLSMPKLVGVKAQLLRESTALRTSRYTLLTRRDGMQKENGRTNQHRHYRVLTFHPDRVAEVSWLIVTD